MTNIASRLCSHAADGQILISQKFLSLVEGVVETEPVGKLSFKGFNQAFDMLLKE